MNQELFNIVEKSPHQFYLLMETDKTLAVRMRGSLGYEVMCRTHNVDVMNCILRDSIATDFIMKKAYTDKNYDVLSHIKIWTNNMMLYVKKHPPKTIHLFDIVWQHIQHANNSLLITTFLSHYIEKDDQDMIKHMLTYQETHQYISPHILNKLLNTDWFSSTYSKEDILAMSSNNTDNEKVLKNKLPMTDLSIQYIISVDDRIYSMILKTLTMENNKDTIMLYLMTRRAPTFNIYKLYMLECTNALKINDFIEILDLTDFNSTEQHWICDFPICLDHKHYKNNHNIGQIKIMLEAYIQRYPLIITANTMHTLYTYHESFAIFNVDNPIELYMKVSSCREAEYYMNRFNIKPLKEHFIFHLMSPKKSQLNNMDDITWFYHNIDHSDLTIPYSAYDLVNADRTHTGRCIAFAHNVLKWQFDTPEIIALCTQPCDDVTERTSVNYNWLHIQLVLYGGVSIHKFSDDIRKYDIDKLKHAYSVQHCQELATILDIHPTVEFLYDSIIALDTHCIEWLHSVGLRLSNEQVIEIITRFIELGRNRCNSNIVYCMKLFEQYNYLSPEIFPVIIQYGQTHNHPIYISYYEEDSNIDYHGEMSFIDILLKFNICRA